MKVKCIGPDDGLWHYNKKYYTTGKLWWKKKHKEMSPGPKTGNILTVEKDFWFEGRKYYVLLEWPNCGGFSSESFVPLEEKFEAVKAEAIKEKMSVN